MPTPAIPRLAGLALRPTPVVLAVAAWIVLGPFLAQGAGVALGQPGRVALGIALAHSLSALLAGAWLLVRQVDFPTSNRAGAFVGLILAIGTYALLALLLAATLRN
jgi:hypothetical protein